MSAASERLARAALCRIAEPGTVALAKLVERVGAVETVERIRRGPSALPVGASNGVSLQLAEGLATRAAECEPEHDLRRLQRCGGRLVCPGDDDWPDRLGDLWRAGSCRRSLCGCAVPAGSASYSTERRRGRVAGRHRLRHLRRR